MPTTIDPQAKIATLINSFTVEPERQRELVDVLARATEEVIRHQAGFISANIHASLDGTRVINYAQWRDAEAFQAMLANPDCQEHMASAARIGIPDPRLCTVASVHNA